MAESERLARVEAPHFVAGLIMVGGRCTHAAPILKWAIGKSEGELRAYFAQKKWRAIQVPAIRQDNPNETEQGNG